MQVCQRGNLWCQGGPRTALATEAGAEAPGSSQQLPGQGRARDREALGTGPMGVPKQATLGVEVR